MADAPEVSHNRTAKGSVVIETVSSLSEMMLDSDIKLFNSNAKR